MHSTKSKGQDKSPRSILDQLADKPRSTQEQCRLFVLPAEIRTYVYELVLSTESKSPQGGVVLRRHDSSNVFFALLLTCRMVYLEAAAIFYDLHTIQFRFYENFEINGFRTYERFIATQSKLRLTGIKKLVVLTRDWNRCETVIIVCKAARELPRLQHLEVFIEQWRSYSTEEQRLKDLTREKYFLKRAVRHLMRLECLKIRHVRTEAPAMHTFETAKNLHDEINAVLPMRQGHALPSTYYGHEKWDVKEDKPLTKCTVDLASWWVF